MIYKYLVLARRTLRHQRFKNILNEDQTGMFLTSHIFSVRAIIFTIKPIIHSYFLREKLLTQITALHC
jgi:hypothetical protein